MVLFVLNCTFHKVIVNDYVNPGDGVKLIIDKWEIIFDNLFTTLSLSMIMDLLLYNPQIKISSIYPRSSGT